MGCLVDVTPITTVPRPLTAVVLFACQNSRVLSFQSKGWWFLNVILVLHQCAVLTAAGHLFGAEVCFFSCQVKCIQEEQRQQAQPYLVTVLQTLNLHINQLLHVKNKNVNNKGYTVVRYSPDQANKILLEVQGKKKEVQGEKDSNQFDSFVTGELTFYRTPGSYCTWPRHSPAPIHAHISVLFCYFFTDETIGMHHVNQ